MGSFLSAFAPCETEVEQRDSDTKSPQHSVNIKASAVFSIPELLEHILLRLPKKTADPDEPTTQLFVLQRVNTTFQATILASKALRLQMDARCQIEKSGGGTNVQFLKYGAKVNRAFNNELNSQVVHLRLHIGPHLDSKDDCEPLEWFKMRDFGEKGLDRLQGGTYADLAPHQILPGDMAYKYAILPHQSWMSIRINAEGNECVSLFVYAPKLAGEGSKAIRGNWQTERSTTWRDVVVWTMMVYEGVERRKGQRYPNCRWVPHLAVTDCGKLVETHADCEW